MKKYLLLLIIISGCLTSKHADKKLSQIGKKFPSKIASIARDSFPLIVTKIDTTFIAIQDTVIWIECPDTTIITNTDTFTLKPSYGKKRIAIAVKLPITTYYITKSVEDSAKIKLMQDDINKLSKQLTTKSTKLTRRTNTMWWLVAVAGSLSLILGIILYFKIRK